MSVNQSTNLETTSSRSGQHASTGTKLQRRYRPPSRLRPVQPTQLFFGLSESTDNQQAVRPVCPPPPFPSQMAVKLTGPLITISCPHLHVWPPQSPFPLTGNLHSRVGRQHQRQRRHSIHEVSTSFFNDNVLQRRVLRQFTTGELREGHSSTFWTVSGRVFSTPFCMSQSPVEMTKSLLAGVLWLPVDEFNRRPDIRAGGQVSFADAFRG